MNSTIALNLTVAQVNVILDALGSKPYAEVYQLIAHIQEQAEPQLQHQPEVQDSHVEDGE